MNKHTHKKKIPIHICCFEIS